jgi:hypothetical protein
MQGKLVEPVNIYSSLSPSRKEMYSKQSPHFSKVDLLKVLILALIMQKSPVKATSFTEKTQLHCRFCGGSSCKHEDWTKCTNPAIKGLHSNWITDHLIASQRLSDRIIKEYSVVEQFIE